MAASLDKQLANARKRAEIAAANYEAKRLEQTYRSIDETHNRRKRTAPSIEIKDEDAQLAGHKRLKSVAKGRDIRRNYGAAKAVETQLGLNGVGVGPKIVVHFGDDAEQTEKADRWSGWFNGPFSKRCSGRNKLHLADQARIAMNTVQRDGDILVFWNEDIVPRAEGTLWYWEADQLPELQKLDWSKNKGRIQEQLSVEDDIEQRDGLILDPWGRTVGYIASRAAQAHGKHAAKFEEVSILPYDSCTLLSNPWRINQRRGVSEHIETANVYQDLERFAEALLQRSIVQSYMAVKIKKRDGMIQARDRATDSEGGDVPDVTDSEVTSGTRYKNFEKLTMNAIEYMEPDEDAEPMQLSGDTPDAEQLIDFFQGQAGWAHGLSNMYATGKADASYSASMAENNLTWMVFHWWQKWIERYYFDWVAERAFRWGMRTGRIDRMPDAVWLDSYSWHRWPQRLAINPLQEANARKSDLSTGAITYEEIWGPEWAKKLAALGRQIQLSRDNGLFVEIFRPMTNGGAR